MVRPERSRSQVARLKPHASSLTPRPGAVHEHFTTALDGLIARVKEDRSVLAAILGGSLSHDQVWKKSDIDLVLVTIDDKLVQSGDNSVALNADGVNIHAMLIARTALRRMIEGSARNSFMHSFLAKGRVIYTHDPTIADLFATLRDIGVRDTQVQLLRAGTMALMVTDKAHKWLVTRGDLDYTALWILYAATSLARIEVVGRRLLADREVLPQALSLNPSFFKVVYTDLLNAKKSRRAIETALEAIDEYIAIRTGTLFGLVIEYLQEVGDIRSATEIETHFARNFDVSGVTTACEYLADRGLIGKASTPLRLTKRSNLEVQELAFYCLDTTGLEA
jgi:hypothetical protein